jgi:8-hydroxy-5-deazaflavin:NADPH oxidoreductase
MRVGILGAGPVGQTLAAKLRELGHGVTIGTRTPRDGAVSYAESAAGAEVVINATSGTVSLDALAAAGADNLAGKVLIDVSNPLDASQGFPPRVAIGSDDSIGEQIQRTYPDARVVKALNTVNAQLMVDPASVPGEHVLFVAGDDADAKAQVVELLGSFGWPAGRIVDLGDIAGARATEQYLVLWIRLLGQLGHARFNVALNQA